MLLPNNIQIELVEGCNRMCQFCGIYGIWKNKEDRQLHFMDLDLAHDIAVDVGKWFKQRRRIEFAMHGEPLLHGYCAQIINAFRIKCSQSQMQLTTNGLQLLKYPGMIDCLFAAGLNILMIDTYVKREEISALCRSKNYEIYDYYNKTKILNPYHYNGYKFKAIVLIDDLAIMNKKKAARKILNHAGNINPQNAAKFGIYPLPAPLRKKCSRLWREIVVHWDGTVPLCCIDWKHEFIVGQFPKDGSLQQIFNSEIFNIVRGLSYNKNRLMRPCYKCDYLGGFRLGFLEKLDLDFSETEYLNKIKQHLEVYNQYTHKNGKTVPFIYKRNNWRNYYV